MLSRHDLVWLNGAGWDAALEGALEGAHATDRAVLDEWRNKDWPLVATRMAPDAAAGTLCLGLSAPPQPGSAARRRIALRAPAAGMARSSRALPLAEAIASAPVVWQPALSALREQARGLDLRVYGSLALQTLTGHAYVGPNSDIDLLFTPASKQELMEGVRMLETQALQLPLDGEIVFPGGAAVAWKEWLMATAGGARVMVKDSAVVRLATTESLLASFHD